MEGMRDRKGYGRKVQERKGSCSSRDWNRMSMRLKY